MGHRSVFSLHRITLLHLGVWLSPSPYHGNHCSSVCPTFWALLASLYNSICLKSWKVIVSKIWMQYPQQIIKSTNRLWLLEYQYFTWVKRKALSSCISTRSFLPLESGFLFETFLCVASHHPFSSFLCVWVCFLHACKSVHHVHVLSAEGGQKHQTSWTSVIDSCELPVGAGIQTWVLWMSSSPCS